MRSTITRSTIKPTLGYITGLAFLATGCLDSAGSQNSHPEVVVAESTARLTSIAHDGGELEILEAGEGEIVFADSAAPQLSVFLDPEFEEKSQGSLVDLYEWVAKKSPSDELLAILQAADTRREELQSRIESGEIPEPPIEEGWQAEIPKGYGSSGPDLWDSSWGYPWQGDYTFYDTFCPSNTFDSLVCGLQVSPSVTSGYTGPTAWVRSAVLDGISYGNHFLYHWTNGAWTEVFHMQHQYFNEYSLIYSTYQYAYMEFYQIHYTGGTDAAHSMTAVSFAKNYL